MKAKDWAALPHPPNGRFPNKVLEQTRFLLQNPRETLLFMFMSEVKWAKTGALLLEPQECVEWLGKAGITQLGKERANGTYCRGLENSHTNLMTLRGVQQCWRIWKSAGDVLPQLWLISLCWCVHLLPEMWLIYPFVLLFTPYFPSFLSFCSILIHCSCHRLIRAVFALLGKFSLSEESNFMRFLDCCSESVSCPANSGSLKLDMPSNVA